MSYQLHIHPLAEMDAEEIANYIAEHSIQGMLNWLDAYEDAQARITESPLAYGLIPDKVTGRDNYHQVLFKTKYGDRYRAVYLVEGETVHLLRVRGKGQKLLRDRDLSNG